LKTKNGRGIIKVISTSKIKKITAIKKKRIEKDSRLDVFTSNPHSKGEGFSRSRYIFFVRAEFKKIRATESLRPKRKIMCILYILLRTLKLEVLCTFIL